MERKMSGEGTNDPRRALEVRTTVRIVLLWSANVLLFGVTIETAGQRSRSATRCAIGCGAQFEFYRDCAGGDIPKAMPWPAGPATTRSARQTLFPERYPAT